MKEVRACVGMLGRWAARSERCLSRTVNHSVSVWLVERVDCLACAEQCLGECRSWCESVSVSLSSQCVSVGELRRMVHSTLALSLDERQTCRSLSLSGLSLSL